MIFLATSAKKSELNPFIFPHSYTERPYRGARMKMNSRMDLPTNGSLHEYTELGEHRYTGIFACSGARF